jgi:NAD(P)-dependent dehydrogenase (short-subunit alcohol dehydrogenase family)
MSQKTCLITGATSGIGRETALALAKKGFRVLAVARSEEKGKAIQAELIKVSGVNSHLYFICDLSLQSAIKSMAEKVRNEIEHLDVLVNNAANVYPDYTESADGIEMQWAVNHLAYVILSAEMLEWLKKAPEGRIVNVSSAAHKQGKINWDDPELHESYNATKAYAQSKLANVLFTKALSKKLLDTDVTVNCLHPGLVKTKIGNKHTNWWQGFIWSAISFFGISDTEGAETSVFLASDPSVSNTTGEYFVKSKIAETNPICDDEDAQRKLMELSLKYIK